MGQENDTGVVTISDHLMTVVSKEFFFDGMVLPVHVYLRMTVGNYLTIGKKGDKVNFSTLHSFTHPNSEVCVKSIDHNHLIQYIADLTGKVVAQKGMPDKVKAKFISSLAEESFTNLEKTNFATVASLQKVSSIVLDLTKTISSFDSIISMLMDMPANASRHAMSTCLISLVLCEEMQLTLRAAQEKVALGALLHDVGQKFVPTTILEKPRHQWSPEDLQTYEQHPIKGVEMLRDLKDVPSDVLLIVAEHHENSQGTGFPKKLRDVKISPLGRIVSLANYVADLLFPANKDSKTYTADEAVRYIEDILGQPFNRQVFLALKNSINKKNLMDKI
jgi:putative nucleotidyltransferase with HDIG domain